METLRLGSGLTVDSGFRVAINFAIGLKNTAARQLQVDAIIALIEKHLCKFSTAVGAFGQCHNMHMIQIDSDSSRTADSPGPLHKSFYVKWNAVNRDTYDIFKIEAVSGAT